jgi:ABC-type proline/glycine betaine transport system substrate-binding protein
LTAYTKTAASIDEIPDPKNTAFGDDFTEMSGVDDGKVSNIVINAKLKVTGFTYDGKTWTTNAKGGLE